MKKRLFFIALLLLTIVACSPARQQVPEAKPQVAPAVEVEYDPDSDTVDRGCSYFYYLWGRTAEAEDKVDEALEAYEKALVCDPDAVQIMRSLGLLLIKSGRTHAAVEWIDKLLRLEPDNIQVRTLLAKLYASLNRTDDAIAEYHAILAKQPDDRSAMLLLGVLYASSGRYQQAAERLEKLVEIEPDSYDGHYYLARLYFELRDYDKTLREYGKAMAINWSDRLAFEAGSVYEQQGRFDEAVELYKRVIDDDGDTEQARRLLVGVYMRHEKPDLALEELRLLRDTAAVDPREIDLVIGRILLDIGRLDQAVRHFETMLSAGRDDDEARILLVMALYRRGDREAAKSVLLEISSRSEGYEDAIQMLAGILRDAGQVAEAEALLLARIAAPETRRPSFYLILADIYVKDGKTERAEAVFKEGLAAFKQDVSILFDYALFLDKAGRLTESLATMKEVLVLEPDNPFALNYVGYVLADNNQQLELAREYIEKAVERRPEDGYIRDSLGWVYFKLGNLERAVAELQEAVRLEPHDPTIYEHFGDALQKAGRGQEAAEAYRRSMALQTEDDKKTRVRQKLDALGDGREANPAAGIQ